MVRHMIHSYERVIYHSNIAIEKNLFGAIRMAADVRVVFYVCA